MRSLGSTRLSRPGTDERSWSTASYIKKGVAFVLVLVGLFSVNGCTPAGTPQGVTVEAFGRHLNDRVPALMSSYDVPGVAVAIVEDSTVVWTKTFGMANRRREERLTQDVIFRAESISKSVTAWGVMKLAEQGEIDLDAPVERYLGEWTLLPSAYGETQVTVRRLLSHTAGFPLGPIGEGTEYSPGGPVPSVRSYLEKEARLVRPPGTTFQYSNVGFNLLERVVEEVTGRNFASYMAEEVLRPLDMNRSSFSWTDSLGAHVATGYEGNGTPVGPYVYPVKASGGLLAPVGDIARFVRASVGGTRNDGPSVLPRPARRRLHTPQVEIPGLYGIVADAYGLGHFIERLSDGRRAVWHGGQGHGWMTHYHAVPASGDGIVILTNSERSWPLMAHVLTDWGRWSGVGDVKMTRIVDGSKALSAITGLLILLFGWTVYRLVRGIHAGTRIWKPAAPLARGRRLVQALFGLSILVGLAWSVAQPYLIVTSIFPTVIPWMAGALLLNGVLLIGAALFPVATD